MSKRQINWAIIAFLFLLSTLVVAQQDEETNPGKLKLGSYGTIATQTTEYREMKTTREVGIKIKIESVDSDGNVKGEFIHETLGKGGKGRNQGLTGKMGDTKELLLKGSLISRFGDTWDIILNVTVEPKALTKGRYSMEARNQAGTVTMTGDFEIAKLEADN